MKKVDTCGMSCPQPLLLTKNALADKPESIEVLVDSCTAQNKIQRYLRSEGYSVTSKSLEEETTLIARKEL